MYAGFAQLGPPIRHTRASTRALRTIARRESAGLVALHDSIGELLDADLIPANVELFGDEHRQRSAHALPDLAAARADDDGVVGMNAHERAERHEARTGGSIVNCRERELRQCERRQQAAAAERSDLEELAARVRHAAYSSTVPP